ncbi:MAG: hypothetical protein FD149_1277 [Rhodospirillaceae bacterium]|nr:MAG: hypothetical protein FD149_1277 [Rhodospirillaceae bacterium]
MGFRQGRGQQGGDHGAAGAGGCQPQGLALVFGRIPAPRERHGDGKRHSPDPQQQGQGIENRNGRDLQARETPQGGQHPEMRGQTNAARPETIGQQTRRQMQQSPRQNGQGQQPRQGIRRHF